LPYDGAVMGTTMSGDPAQLQRFASVETPTLILYGGATEPWIAAAAHAITAVLPNATSDVLPGQTHDVSPEVTTPAITKFFS
jgi:pimeloyl-ACP methyl ester carboxylesterase